MKFKIAERFKSIQGEGVYAGTPMAFIRFVGCSVGKRICQHCDTDFEKVGSDWRGGGEFTHDELLAWAKPYEHICLTGGEPLDQDLMLLVQKAYSQGHMIHLETSGTKAIDIYDISDPLWVCVSPKPGFIENVVMLAHEVKVIVPGLGEITNTLLRQIFTGEEMPLLEVKGDGTNKVYLKDQFRWPTLEDALRWAAAGKTVFLQPRNGKFDIDKQNLLYVQDVIAQHPQLRLSVQMHKILKVQ